MRNQTTNLGRNARQDGRLQRRAAELLQEEVDLFGTKQGPTLGRSATLPESPQPRELHDRLLELLTQPKEPLMKRSIDDRLIDEGVREWNESEREQRLPRTETSWPETMEELVNTPAANSPDKRVQALAETANKVYNGTNVTKFSNLAKPVTPLPVQAGRAAAETFRLEFGSGGDEVKMLQRYLNKLGYTDENGKPLTEDGDFGIHTQAAVDKFKDAVLPGSNTEENRGIVDAATWEALRRSVSNKLGAESRGAILTTANAPIQASAVPNSTDIWNGFYNDYETEQHDDTTSDNNSISPQSLLDLKTDDEKFAYLFDDYGVDSWSDSQFYQTPEEALAHMVTIKVNVWTIDAAGKKVPSTINLTVNKKISSMVSQIFEEIFNDPEKFL
jgi:peptidoglycan hydrolase-like protein with peptidoglycan-binding domain